MCADGILSCFQGCITNMTVLHTETKCHFIHTSVCKCVVVTVTGYFINVSSIHNY